MRRQLTLFVGAPWRLRLDALRRALDPVQAGLIGAHVTLCREDELSLMDETAFEHRTATWPHGPVQLSFGPAERVGGHGVLLPCTAGTSRFQQLRQWMLRDDRAREHGAHLTLAHPRNPRSVENTHAALATCPEALALDFGAVALIEQHGSDPWRVLREAALRRRTPDSADARDAPPP